MNKFDIASHEYVGFIKEHGIKVTLPFLISTAKHPAMMKVKQYGVSLNSVNIVQSYARNWLPYQVQ